MKESLLVAALIASPFVLVGVLLGGIPGGLTALALALIAQVGAYALAKHVVLKMVDASVVDGSNEPDLVKTVQGLALRASIRQPAVAISRFRTPNAFAAGSITGGVIGVTSGLLEITSPAELEAVLAHEIAHLTNRDRYGVSIAAVFAALPGAIGAASGSDLFFDRAFRRGMYRRWGGRHLRPVRDAIAFCSVPIAALLVRSSVSRSTELGADARAAALIDDPAVLVSALRKIDALAGRVAASVNPAMSHLLVIHPFGEERVSRIFNTHPGVSERIAALMKTTA